MVEGKVNNLIVKRYYPELDGLRALAVLLVLWWHSSQWAYNISPAIGKLSISYFKVSVFGACGVSLFFVLSGFLITGILMDTAKDKNCLKNFYIRRSLRIFPLYYLSLIIFTILSLLIYSDFNYNDHIYSYIFYVQNLTGLFWGESSFRDKSWIFFDHFWSLAVEEQFYLIWPAFFLWAYNRLNFYKLFLVFTGFIIMSVAIRYYLTMHGVWKYAHINSFARADALIMGALVVYTMKMNKEFFVFFKKISDFIMPLFPIILIISILYLTRSGPLFTVYAQYIISLGSIFSFFLIIYVINVSADRNLFQRVLCSAVMKYLSRVSYGFYIFHIPVLTILQYCLQEYTSMGYWPYHAILFFVGGIITLVIASISYRYFEKPILSLKDRYAPLS